MPAAKNQFVHAMLIPISGNNDDANMDKAVTVQFNPTSLKVSLASTLNENARSGQSRSAQFVDKSSSNLTVELVFDTTLQGPEVQDSETGEKRPEWTESSDVRVLTGKIADRFMKTTGTGNNLRSPSRCSFLWGAFQFNGIMESFDETLDFFSPTGIPLRSTVALKLSESRYQFRTRGANAAARDTPKLSSTGNAGDGSGDGGSVNDANKEAKKKGKDWRNTALFNGIESPRLPNVPVLAVPNLTASASLSGLASASAAPGGSLGAAANGVVSASPSFNFGASSTLGTNVAGAFSPASISSNSASSGELRAGAIASGSAAMRSGASLDAGASSSSSGTATADAQANSSVGFD